MPSSQPIAFLIVNRMLLTGFDAPLEQALYVDRSVRGTELLQAIARTSRTSRNKAHGLVVDYVALTDNLSLALEEYDAKDLDEMREELVVHELPLLEARAEILRGLIGVLGAFLLRRTAGISCSMFWRTESPGPVSTRRQISI